MVVLDLCHHRGHVYARCEGRIFVKWREVELKQLAVSMYIISELITDPFVVVVQWSIEYRSHDKVVVVKICDDPVNIPESTLNENRVGKSFLISSRVYLLNLSKLEKESDRQL